MSQNNCKNLIKSGERNLCGLILGFRNPACEEETEDCSLNHVLEKAQSGGKTESTKTLLQNSQLSSNEKIAVLLEGKRLLVVDDDPVTSTILSQMVPACKATALCAQNGQEAFEMLSKHDDIGLVYLDLVMPVMDGFEFLKEANKEMPERVASLNILVISALDNWKAAREVIELGAKGYVPKPVNVDEITSDTLETLLFASE